MGLDDLQGKATDAVGKNSEKVEDASDQGLDKAGEFAEGKGAGEHADKGKDFLDGKVGE